MNKVTFGALALVLVAAGAGGYYLKATQPAEANTSPANVATPIAVSLVAPRKETLSELFHTYGDLVAVRSTDVVSRVAGLVQKIHVEDGQVVSKGAPLVEIDASVADAELQSAKAKLAVAQAALSRAEQLSASGTISAVQMEKAKLDFDVASTEVKLKSANRALYTIRAPFSGRLSTFAVVEGALVQSGQTLTRAVDESRLRVNFRVPERLWSRIKVGQNLQIVSAGGQGRSVAGKVSYVSPEADPKSRSLAVSGIIDNADGALVGGLFADLHVEVGRRVGVTTLPLSSIQRALSGTFAYTVEKGMAKRVKLALGLEQGSSVEVISGLAPGQKVIRSGLGQVRDGMMVRISKKD